jgi:hypothetical protein
MHPELSLQIVLDRIAGLHRRAERNRWTRDASSIELRRNASREELERLAALSERPLHEGNWIVADVDGVPVAAVSVEDGTTVYDPFRPTAQAVSLLQFRRKQMLATAF